jgi:hypothetical protein
VGEQVVVVDEVNQLLDLQDVPAGEYWNRIMAAARTLDDWAGAAPGPPRAWCLKVLVADAPEVSIELPHLLTHLAQMDIHHEITREAGGVQGLLLGRSR